MVTSGASLGIITDYLNVMVDVLCMALPSTIPCITSGASPGIITDCCCVERTCGRNRIRPLVEISIRIEVSSGRHTTDPLTS